ncbi:MAG TPA: hypothetical protein VES73_16695, partial [Lamprocystis sp. (in: g-proteobacteria)]|nr:hypothetical protein [Lamprocystis sp. (in: g-proteobacteria)]
MAPSFIQVEAWFSKLSPLRDAVSDAALDNADEKPWLDRSIACWLERRSRWTSCPTLAVQVTPSAPGAAVPR